MNEHLGTDIALYLDGPLNEQDKARIERHLSSCAECREELESMKSLKLRMTRLPQRTAPAALMRDLKKTYGAASWLDTVRNWFTWHNAWKPIGALALTALMAGVWVNRWKSSEEEFIDMDPLVTAHARYQAESLVPSSDMASCGYSGKLAAYYGDEN